MIDVSRSEVHTKFICSPLEVSSSVPRGREELFDVAKRKVNTDCLSSP